MIAVLAQDDRLADLQSLLDAVPLAVLLLDRTIAVRLVNAEAADLLKGRAELRIVGPTMHVRRKDELLGFEEAIRSIFASGNNASFTFFSRAGVAELTVDMRLAKAVDLVLAVVSLVTPGIKLLTVPTMPADVA